MRVVATAGHVDHGKSSLVLALTGTDPDRFPEEKARGLTIDLGFAFATLPSATLVGFVDVPGHVKFVKNMLAGVGAVDVAILVVAATEGWMPQSEEHFSILRLLCVEHGMVVITKAALVDDETLELAQLELDDHLAGTAAAEWPVVVVDSPTGRGIDEVRATLDAVLTQAPVAFDTGRPRLWVDRVFAARGSGTVVTGTLTGGSLCTDTDVVVEPGARRARIRGLESHGTKLERVEAGSRVAINLAGIDRAEVTRGDAIILPHQWQAVDAFDAEVLSLPGQSLPRRGQLAVHVGSGEYAARFRLLDADGRFARVRLDTALPIAPDDRVVVRSTGRRATVGGARILDVRPARRTAAALARLELPLAARLLDAHPWITPGDVVASGGVSAADARSMIDGLIDSGRAVRVNDRVVSAATLDDLRARARVAVRAHHHRFPRERGLELAELASTLHLDSGRLRAVLDGWDDLVIDTDVVRSRDHRGAAVDDPEGQRFLAALRADPFSPPAPDELGIDPALVRGLTKDGEVVNLDGVIFASDAIREAHRIVGTAVVQQGSLTVADIRNLLGSTRKFVLPIVGWLDANGVTRRRSDDRIPGPRALPE